MEDDGKMQVLLNEPAARALLSAIDFTLEKWAGQEPIDQELLMKMRYSFRGMLLEFNFQRE